MEDRWSQHLRNWCSKLPIGGSSVFLPTVDQGREQEKGMPSKTLSTHLKKKASCIGKECLLLFKQVLVEST